MENYTIVRWIPKTNGGFKEIRELVEGRKTKYFGIREEEGKGYRITHLPSGYLLTLASFQSAEDAYLFATEVEARLSNLLASRVPSVLRDLADIYLNARIIRNLILGWNKTKPVLTKADFKGVF